MENSNLLSQMSLGYILCAGILIGTMVTIVLMVLKMIISIPASIMQHKKEIKESRAYRQFIENMFENSPFPLFGEGIKPIKQEMDNFEDSLRL